MSDQIKIEDELDAALAALDQEPLPESTQADAVAVSSAGLDEQQPEPEHQAQADSASPTLGALDESRRPKASTVCEDCPNSVWFASPVEVKCYCRVMFLVTWSSKEPNQITNCDGLFLGQE